MPELIKVERWAKVAPFNPLSPHQVKAYIRKMGYPMPKHRTDRDEFGERKDTTNDESLSELLREGKPGEGDEVLEGTLKVRHISKGASYLAGTYVRPDGRLHPVYTMRPKQRLSCVPLDHQMLTARGWAGPDTLRVGEPVAAYMDGALAWVPLLGVHRGTATTGSLLVGRSWRADFRCTPDHKWLTADGSLVEAQDLKGALLRLGSPGLSGDSAVEAWKASLVGWALTDGTIIRTSSGSAALQIQVRKPTTIAALDDLLGGRVPHTRTDALNKKYRYVRYYVGTKVFGPLWQEVEDAGVVAWVLTLSSSGKQAVWDAMMEADGSYDPSHGERFGKQRRDPLDVYQALAVALGKQAIFSQRAPKGSSPVGYEARFTDIQVRPEPVQRACFAADDVVEEVWCPETPAGTWVCRSGSSLGITGNSASPNVMNMPKGKKGEVLKRASRELLSSVVADPGFTLFSCDWNSLHPALIAYFAGDPQYARVARLGDHANVLSHYLGRPVDLNRSDEEVKAELDALKEAHPAEYKTCKIGNLAYKYLQGPMNMAKSLGLSLERTLAIRAAIDRAAPKVAAWKWKVLEQAHFKGRLVSPFGLPLCVAPESRILTQDLRWVTAGSLREGDELLAFDEYPLPGRSSRRFASSTVLAAAPGRAPVARVRLSDGSSVVTTLDHPWLAKFSYKSGQWAWKKTYELRPGSRVMKPLEPWATKTTYGAGWLAGLFDGEGCWTTCNSSDDSRRANILSVFQNPGPVLEQAERLLTAEGYAYTTAPRIRVTNYGKSDNATIRIGGPLADKLRFLGEIRPVRLLNKVSYQDLGQLREPAGSPPVFVEAVEPLGMGDITVLETSSRTYFAEGFAMHNTFFDVFRVKDGKVERDRDGKPKLGLEAPEACSFFPLSTESGMLREVLVDLGSQEECWSTFKLSIPEHDKVIGQIRDGEVDRILDSLVIPSMNRSWPELGGLRVGVDVEVGKTMQEMRAR